MNTPTMVESTRIQLKVASTTIWSVLNETGDTSTGALHVYVLLKCAQRFAVDVFDSYLTHRLSKVRGLRWETGPVIPDKIRHDTLSARENDYFGSYNSLLADYLQDTDLDLTTNLEVMRLFWCVWSPPHLLVTSGVAS